MLAWGILIGIGVCLLLQETGKDIGEWVKRKLQ